jgi:4-amino-4-deoxy-L-arabinose transferase-like glycosyltransferase
MYGAGLIALVVFVFFGNLWRYGLWEPDEARYAEIAREMIESGNYIVPHLNYVAYVEKPPLLYWLTSISFGLLGLNEFAARVPVAVSALAGVLATLVFTIKTYGRRNAILAAAILTTFPLYSVLAQVLTTDMTLTALTTIASFAMFLHWKEGGRWCWFGYVAMALAVMTKGPVGAAIPILAMLAFLFWQRDFRGVLGRFHAISGFALVALICAPWFIVMTLREPGYFNFYFVGEHIRRALVPDYSHSEPIWFYVPVLVGGLAPWSLMVPILTWRGVSPDPARRFCLIAAIVIVAMFSASSGKLIPYVLPAVPFLAVLIADGIASCVWPTPGVLRPPDTRILVESGGLLILIGVGVEIAAALADRFRTPYALVARPAMLVVGALFIAWGVVATICFLRRRAELGLAAVVAAMACAFFAGTYMRIELEPLRSYADLSRTVAARSTTEPLLCYHRYVQSLAFYNHRRVMLVGSRTELDFGARRDPEMRTWFLGNDRELFDWWNRPGRKVVVLDADDLDRMKPRFGEYEIIASEGRKRAIIGSGSTASH